MQQCYYTGYEEKVMVDGEVIKRLIPHSENLARYAWNENHRRISGTRIATLCDRCARSVGAWQIRGQENAERVQQPVSPILAEETSQSNSGHRDPTL